MNNRTLIATSRACFVVSLLMAVSALYHFVVHPLNVNPGWLLIATGSLFVVGGLIAQNVNHDQTDALTRTQSQNELLQAEMAQRQNAIDVLADGLDIAIFICDLRASILYANRRAMEMFNFANPIGRTILAVTLSYDLEQLVFDACRLNDGQDGELNFTYPGERVGLVKAWPQPDGGRVFVSIYEITDLRRLERVRQDFVSNVSHELRTPLTIIRAMAETLLDDPDATHEIQERYLTKVIT